MDLVAQAAASFGSSPALHSTGRTFSFDALEQETARIARVAAASGICQGDIVAIVSPNSTPMLLTLIALLRIGAVAAPVNNRFPASHIAGVLERLSPKLTLFDPNSGPAPCGGCTGLDTFVTAVTPAANQSITPATDQERPVSIIHTSASSGKPKAALHSFSNHWHNATGSAVNLPFHQGDAWLLSLPLYHIGGYSMIFKCLTGGGAITVPDSGMSLETALGTLPITHLSLVPTQLYRMLRSPAARACMQKLRAILLGGSPASQPLLSEALRAELQVYLTYGSTEMGSQISTSAAPLAGVVTDSGNILPHREAIISDDGEILVKGPCLFMGYLEPGRLNDPRDAAGWFHTGDAGTLDGQGRLTVHGRLDNMFISGGENIHPEEIEKALAAIEGISEALVVPTPDMEYGARPVAWLRVSDEETPADEVITARLRQALGRLKTPVAFYRVREWVTIAGSAKINRQWYRDEAAAKVGSGRL